MPSGEASWLLDSNVLLRLSKTEDPEQVTIERAILHLVSQGVRLCYTSQSLGEFWNVSPAL